MRAHLCATLILGALAAPDTAWSQSADPNLDTVARELERLQQDVQRKNREIGNLLESYEKQGGRLPEGFGPNLTEEQRKLLSQRFQAERLGLGATLQDILDRDREIAGLKRRIAEIEGVAPYSVVAKAGDTHMGLVRAYLTQRGVKPNDIARLLSTVSLHPSLVAGNRVWILYRGGQLGTWVTAGDTRLSVPRAVSAPPPSAAAGLPKGSAASKIRALELAIAEADRERTALRKETAELRADIGKFSQEADLMRDLAKAAVQAARYTIGSKHALMDHGILAGNWLRGTRVHRLHGMDMLDLTKSSQIVVRASDHGLMRIEKLSMLPDGFVPDQDYKVDFFEDGQVVRIAILDMEKFKSSAFVVVLE